MPLLGTAAMLLTFDVVDDAIEEHDDWHTHEHLPERLSIPGFLRGTRWVADRGGPRYMVLYEVEQLETLASPAYLERLNHPSPWTRTIMPHYRGMTRGLCRVVSSQGPGLGHAGVLVRFKPAPDAQASLVRWLVESMMPQLPMRPGLGSVHLLRSGLAAAMTSEQQIRGADAGVDWALLATGYDAQAVADLAAGELGSGTWEMRGAVGAVGTTYRAACSLLAQELGAGPAARSGRPA